MKDDIILTEEDYQFFKLETMLIELTESVFEAEDLERLQNEVKRAYWNYWKRYKVKKGIDD